MTQDTIFPAEFARIIRCTLCPPGRSLLRDDFENVPQPGYVGRRYAETGVLLVGQNPGTPKRLDAADKPYTLALRRLRDEPTIERYAELRAVLDEFIPRWPVHGSYFPLAECGLSLDQIAYCNVVRCRTPSDKTPSEGVAKTCAGHHFARWITLLRPNVVVFIGKRAAVQGSGLVRSAGIPYAFMNRQRSLSSSERATNRKAVAELVRSCRRQQGNEVPEGHQ